MKFNFKPGDGWEQALLNAAQSAIAPYFKAAKAVMKDITDDAYDYAQSLATQRLHSTSKKYLDALQKYGDDGNWTIVLNEDAVYLEEGYPSFDQISAGLARGAKSHYSDKTGRRYVRIPFEQVQAFAKASHPMNSVVVQRDSSNPTTKGDLSSDLKRLRKIFTPNEDAISLDPSGRPIQGKVWSISKSATGPQWNYQEFQGEMKKSMEIQPQPNSLLSGITKVQFQTDSGKMRSRYLTWRTATDPRVPSAKDNKSKWIHPGFDGVHIMKDVERYINDQFAAKIDRLFTDAGGV
jgi:hypothetical protein